MTILSGKGCLTIEDKEQVTRSQNQGHGLKEYNFVLYLATIVS